MSVPAETCTEETSKKRQAKRKRTDSGNRSQTEGTEENTVAPVVQSIPSKEIREPWIYAFAPNFQEMEIDYSKFGKWLLFHNNQKKCETTGLTDHDLAWQHIESLVLNDYKNAGIIEAKASTALAAATHPSGVICCYVADYTNKYDVKRAAAAIRRVINLSCPIYFKTDEATYAGQYNRLGTKQVCLYKHTPNNDLFERDEFGKWRKLDI